MNEGDEVADAWIAVSSRSDRRRSSTKHAVRLAGPPPPPLPASPLPVNSNNVLAASAHVTPSLPPRSPSKAHVALSASQAAHQSPPLNAPHAGASPLPSAAAALDRDADGTTVDRNASAAPPDATLAAAATGDGDAGTFAPAPQSPLASSRSFLRSRSVGGIRAVDGSIGSSGGLLQQQTPPRPSPAADRAAPVLLLASKFDRGDLAWGDLIDEGLDQQGLGVFAGAANAFALPNVDRLRAGKGSGGAEGGPSDGAGGGTLGGGASVRAGAAVGAVRLTPASPARTRLEDASVSRGRPVSGTKPWQTVARTAADAAVGSSSSEALSAPASASAMSTLPAVARAPSSSPPSTNGTLPLLHEKLSSPDRARPPAHEIAAMASARLSAADAARLRIADDLALKASVAAARARGASERVAAAAGERASRVFEKLAAADARAEEALVARRRAAESELAKVRSVSARQGARENATSAARAAMEMAAAAAAQRREAELAKRREPAARDVRNVTESREARAIQSRVTDDARRTEIAERLARGEARRVEQLAGRASTARKFTPEFSFMNALTGGVRVPAAASARTVDGAVGATAVETGAPIAAATTTAQATIVAAPVKTAQAAVPAVPRSALTRPPSLPSSNVPAAAASAPAAAFLLPTPPAAVSTAPEPVAMATPAAPPLAPASSGAAPSAVSPAPLIPVADAPALQPARSGSPPPHSAVSASATTASPTRGRISRFSEDRSPTLLVVAPTALLPAPVAAVPGARDAAALAAATARKRLRKLRTAVATVAAAARDVSAASAVSGGAGARTAVAALALPAVGRALSSLDRAVSVEDVEVVDSQTDSLPALTPVAVRALVALADTVDTATAPPTGTLKWGGAAAVAVRAAAEVAGDHLYSAVAAASGGVSGGAARGAPLSANDADAIVRVAGVAARAIASNGGGAGGAAGAGVRALAALVTPSRDAALALLVSHAALPGVALIDISLAATNDAVASSSPDSGSAAGGGGGVADDGATSTKNKFDVNSDELVFAATGLSVASLLIGAGGDAAVALASYALGAGIARTASRLALLLASTAPPAPPAALASAATAALSLLCATARAAAAVRDAGKRGDLNAAYATAVTDAAQSLLAAAAEAAQRTAPFGNTSRVRVAALVLCALNAGPASHDGSAGAALARALRGDDAGVRWSSALARTLDGTRAAGTARALVNDLLIPAALVSAGAAALGGAADTRGLLAAALALPPRWATEPAGRAALFPTLLAAAAADGALVRALADDVDVATLADAAAADAAASESTPLALRIERRLPREARAALAATLRRSA